MARPNAFVKISGNLLQNTAVEKWLRTLAESYFVVVCIGGGEQINEAFSEREWPVRFGPLGRITTSLPERQVARDALEQNQAAVQDMLDEKGINARVIIPVEEIGGVLCHVNGDVLMLAAYLGFDKLFLLTLTERVERKKEWLQKVGKALGEAELCKIEILGF